MRVDKKEKSESNVHEIQFVLGLFMSEEDVETNEAMLIASNQVCLIDLS